MNSIETIITYVNEFIDITRPIRTMEMSHDGYVNTNWCMHVGYIQGSAQCSAVHSAVHSAVQ